HGVRRSGRPDRSPGRRVFRVELLHRQDRPGDEQLSLLVCIIAGALCHLSKSGGVRVLLLLPVQLWQRRDAADWYCARSGSERGARRSDGLGAPVVLERCEVIPGKKYTPEDIVKMVWKRKWLIAIPCALAATAAVVWTHT